MKPKTEERMCGAFITLHPAKDRRRCRSGRSLPGRLPRRQTSPLSHLTPRHDPTSSAAPSWWHFTSSLPVGSLGPAEAALPPWCSPVVAAHPPWCRPAVGASPSCPRLLQALCRRARQGTSRWPAEAASTTLGVLAALRRIEALSAASSALGRSTFAVGTQRHVRQPCSHHQYQPCASSSD